MRVSILLKELNISKKTLAVYLESLGIHVNSVNQKIEDDNVLNTCRLHFNNDALKYKERLKQLNKEKKETSPFDRLINECNFHINFENDFRATDIESLKELEFSIKKRKKYLIDKVNKYKSFFLLKDTIDSKEIQTERINILDKLLTELNKPTELKLIQEISNNKTYNVNRLRRKTDIVVDDESMIMASFRNGTSENFGF